MSSEKFSENEIGLVTTDWKEKKIGEVCKLVRKSFKPAGDDIRHYIGLEHIAKNSLKLKGIGSSSDVKSAKYEFKKGQILFGKLRPYFRKVYRPDFDGVCSTDIFVIDSEEGYDNGFLFYFFANPEIIEEATRSSEGTRMPRASWDYLSNLTRYFPPLSEQEEIGQFLSNLDKKIEINQKMNQILEEIGQAIFKHWFIDFEFPDDDGKPYKSNGGEMVDSVLGKIPKNWKIKNIGELAQVKGRIGWKGYKTSDLRDEGPWVIGGKDITSDCVDLTNANHISFEKFKESPEIILKHKDVIIAKTGTIGPVALYDKAIGPATINPNVGIIRCKSISPELLFFFLKTDRAQYYIKEFTTSSVQPAINLATIKKLEIAIPTDNNLLEIIEDTLNSIYELQNQLNKENINLAKIRDSLIPRLMFGKIRVKENIDITDLDQHPSKHLEVLE